MKLLILNIGLIAGIGGGAAVAVIAVIAVTMMNDSNNEIIQQQEARLNQLELEQQLDREMEVCKNHALVSDFDSFYYCMDGIVSNPNYVLDPQAVANYKMERDRHFAQSNSINLANCNLSPMQQMQIDALKNDDSIDPQVAFAQIMQIMEQSCR